MDDRTTVIIPTFNREKYVLEAINSILSQSCKPAQVIVVNDGSTDGTERVLRTLGDRVEILTKENGGKPSALNHAMKHVRGNLVWIFDDDDVALPDALQKLTDALKAHPDAGFAYGSYYWARENDAGELVRGALNPTPLPPANELFLHLMENCFFKHTATLVRRECYAAAGEFDVEQVRSEDYDMQLRLCRRFDGVGVDAPIMWFRDHLGVRGNAALNHKASDRDSIHMQYDQMVCRKLYKALAIEEYLPRDQQTEISDPQKRRQALLQRACVIGRRALWDWALDDIAAAAGMCDEPLTATEQRIAASTFHSPPAFRLAPPGLTYFVRLRSALKNAESTGLAAALGKGLYWCASEQTGLDRLKTLSCLAAFSGVRGARAIFRARLGGNVIAGHSA